MAYWRLNEKSTDTLLKESSKGSRLTFNLTSLGVPPPKTWYWLRVLRWNFAPKAHFRYSTKPWIIQSVFLVIRFARTAMGIRAMTAQTVIFLWDCYRLNRDALNLPHAPKAILRIPSRSANLATLFVRLANTALSNVQSASHNISSNLRALGVSTPVHGGSTETIWRNHAGKTLK